LFKKIKSRSLLICGDEVPVVDYWFQNELKYSVLTPYFQDKSLEKHFQFPLKYRKESYRKTFEWLNKNCKQLITSDLDYEIPMQKMGFSTTFIPNPINTDKIVFQPLENITKIVIFLGINRLSYLKKGINYFEKALEIVRKKYADKVEIIVTENLPYDEYISIYNKAHILLDQVFAYDQGYNALEAMAKGKVVFTGAETDFLNQYQLQEDEICINALPDENKIAAKLSYLIEHPEKIIEISENARNFIEKEHDYKVIAGKYLGCWFKE
jgi:glycosyltransferase involved in cell wall biosynthesis